MSRSGYVDDIDDMWAFIRHRGAVASAIAGKRGQAFLREMAAVLDAMPEKRLACATWIDGQNVCALGAVAEARGKRSEFASLDPEDEDTSARAAGMLGIAEAMAREIVFMNDEGVWVASDQERWIKMRAWVQARIAPSPPSTGEDE